MNNEEFATYWIDFYTGKDWEKNAAILELIRRAGMTSPDGEFNEVIISLSNSDEIISILESRIDKASYIVESLNIPKYDSVNRQNRFLRGVNTLHGKLVFNKQGGFILKSHNGAYFEQLKKWELESLYDSAIATRNKKKYQFNCLDSSELSTLLKA